MSKEKEITQLESGFPAMRYRPSDAACGYEYIIVNSSAEEKKLGSEWYINPELKILANKNEPSQVSEKPRQGRSKKSDDLPSAGDSA